MKKITFLTLFTLFVWMQIVAQAPLFSYNLYRYNPAAAATSSNWAATMDYNSYVPNLYSLGNSSNLNVEKRFTKFHSALGFNTHRFVLGEGYLFRQDINLSYSYQWILSQKENSPILAFGAESGLSGRLIGVTGGYYSYNYQYNLFPNLNAGVHFYLPNQKFYAGVSMMDILQTHNQGNSSKVEYLSSYQFMSGYRFSLGKKLFLQPNFLLKIAPQHSYNNYNSLDINLQLQHKKWEAGLSYSRQNFIGINAGICIAKRFYVRGSYNYITSRLNVFNNVSNISIMLAYRSVSGSK